MSHTTTQMAASVEHDGTEASKRDAQKPSDRYWLAMTVLASLTAAYALNFLAGGPPAPEEIRSRLVGTPWGLSHVVGGVIAIACGPFQYLQAGFRKKYFSHVWNGRLYTLGIVMGSAGSLGVVADSYVGPVGAIGFILLGLLWFATTTMGLLSIWSGKVKQHQNWMTRSFSLTYAAVMLRWQLPLLMLAGGMTVTQGLEVTAWSCWIPNLIFAELVIIKKEKTA